MRRSVTNSRGFTLVELLIVAVVLSIFAAVVVPNLSGSDDDARIAAAATAVRAAQRQIDLQFARTGTWPATLSTEWFQGYKLPSNPLFSDPIVGGTIRYSSTNDAGKWHPNNKQTDTRGFWYNPANGVLRATVPTAYADGLSIYNTINNANVTADQTTRA